MLTTNIPAVESCTKNLPCQFGSATVTTPVIEIGIFWSTWVDVSDNTLAAFMRTSSVAAGEQWEATIAIRKIAACTVRHVNCRQTQFLSFVRVSFDVTSDDENVEK